MKKYYLLTIATFVIIITVKAQDNQYHYGLYYKNIVTAQQKILTDSLQKEKWQMDSVNYYYQQAFKLQPPFPSDLNSYAWYSYNKKYYKQTQSAIYEAVINGYQYYPEAYEKANAIADYTIHRRDTTSAFGRFKDSVLSLSYDSLRSIFLQGCTEIDYFNIMLVQEHSFQRGRGNFIHDTILNLENSQIFKIQIDLEKYPFSFLFNLLREDKFPDRRKTRNYSDYAINIILIHEVVALKEEDSKEFFDLLWKEVLKGNIKPYYYSTLYDWYHNGDIEVPDKESTFGTIIEDRKFIDGVLDGGQMTDVKNPKKINELRKNHYLLSIEDYAKSYNYKLPENYIQKNE